MISFSIFDITDGVMDCTFSSSEDSCRIFGCDLWNTPRDLLLIALGMIYGDPSGVAYFTNEPGYFKMLFRQTGDKVVLEIAFLEDDESPSDVGRLLFMASDTLDNWCRQLVSAMEHVLVLYGQDGYFEHWNSYEFPMAELSALQQHTLSTKKTR